VKSKLGRGRYVRLRPKGPRDGSPGATVESGAGDLPSSTQPMSGTFRLTGLSPV
jgi:hypothetical protein